RNGARHDRRRRLANLLGVGVLHDFRGGEIEFLAAQALPGLAGLRLLRWIHIFGEGDAVARYRTAVADADVLASGVVVANDPAAREIGELFGKAGVAAEMPERAGLLDNLGVREGGSRRGE